MAIYKEAKTRRAVAIYKEAKTRRAIEEEEEGRKKKVHTAAEEGELQGRARTWIQGGKGGPEVTLFAGDVASEATC